MKPLFEVFSYNVLLICWLQVYRSTVT